MISKVDILKAKIIREISSGKIQPDDLLPSRHQYMRRYSCARGTIDSAIAGLSRDGFVYSRQGGGTYVAKKSPNNTIQQICIINASEISEIIGDGLQSGNLAGECQATLPCSIYAENDVYVNLDKFARLGNGVVWVRPSYNLYMAMNYLANLGIPQLLIGRNFGDFDFVTTDAKSGIYEGLEYMKEKSSEIAFVSDANNPDRPYIAERQIAFYQSCVELGIRMRGEWIFDFDTASFSSEISRIGKCLFLENDTPRAIFLSSFTTAMPLITFAEAHGKILGKDFDLLIFDKALTLMNHPGISMLEQKWEKMAATVIEWISVKKSDMKKEFKRKIKTELIK